ncbi:MAG: exopolyphosphatase / guanosine-5-triphosphate,3-diphosphate pyrophosphatase [Actinomycetota bacterium]|jgi:exopolyphosphatase/guanosine-5'-triphosphate,3'-diphosphate pyrophosphatase|nr:exopolyphosphatase / guanosine-5-triphosphate,3-diphosphate pyrophosphatase [Actinomycetota bacterium]
MRLGVLDVGSNTVHLLVVDAHPGAHPDPVRSHKTELQLAELLGDDGSLGEHGIRALVEAVATARAEAEKEGVEDLVAFATSAVRDATDSAEVLARVREDAGVDLQVLPGADEARLTFLAVRRWFGWSAGRLLCLDIGGGSLELAVGIDEEPDVAVSLPLGAGRLTRERLADDPPRRRDVTALREHVREVLADTVPAITGGGPPDRAAATSKTFRSLARLDGAAPYADGPRVPRALSRAGLERLVDLLAGMRAVDRARLPGVSPSRALQLLAGAVVAHEALDAFGLDSVDVCPWALREGVILRRLDWLGGA